MPRLRPFASPAFFVGPVVLACDPEPKNVHQAPGCRRRADSPDGVHATGSGGIAFFGTIFGTARSIGISHWFPHSQFGAPDDR